MKILIAGDFCPQNRVPVLFDKGEYASVLGQVKPIIEQADYSFVNFECPVTHGDENPIDKQGPNLHCSDKGVEAVKWARFNCVTLANNHFMDYGERGVKNTLEACKNNEIEIVGGGLNLQEASRNLYKEIAGKTLAVINCCEHEFSIASEKTAGSNPLNPIQQYYAIREAREKADYILVIVHGGHEYWQLPSPRMQETYRFFIDAGADAVVNHHQHCFSGYEVYKEKPIFYGLGNFCFDGNRSHQNSWHEGYMLMLNLGASIEYSIIPYRQCDETPAVEIIGNREYDEQIVRLNQIINNQSKLKQETEKYYGDSANYYSNIFEPCRNRFYQSAKARGWLPSFISKERKLAAANHILCEAHRDKLSFWLNNNK